MVQSLSLAQSEQGQVNFLNLLGLKFMREPKVKDMAVMISLLTFLTACLRQMEVS